MAINCKLSFAGDVMVNRNCSGTRRIQVTRQGKNQASQVCWAARTPPGPDNSVMRTIARKRVVVKERFAVNPEPSQDAIIKAALHHIGVSAVEVDMNHTVSPKKQANRSARFRIAFQVRQVVILRKSLILGSRAQAAGQVEL